MRPTTPELVRKPNGDGKLTATSKEAFAQNRYRKYRFQRDSILQNAPPSSGVFGIYNAFWIHIGESENIRSCLLDLLARYHPCMIHHKPSGFAFELLASEDRRGRREELVNALEPLCKEKA